MPGVRWILLDAVPPCSRYAGVRSFGPAGELWSAVGRLFLLGMLTIWLADLASYSRFRHFASFWQV